MDCPYREKSLTLILIAMIDSISAFQEQDILYKNNVHIYNECVQTETDIHLLAETHKNTLSSKEINKIQQDIFIGFHHLQLSSIKKYSASLTQLKQYIEKHASLIN